ncbi:MAG: response regulator [Chloroflexi bacterium]|nr:response regulator [Chloroflexota bacterium]
MATKKAKNKKILVVDADKEIGDLVRFVLSEEGYQVFTCRSLSEAARLLSTSHFDVIITEAFAQKDVFKFDPTYLSAFRDVAPTVPIILFSSYCDQSYPVPEQYGLAGSVRKLSDLFELIRKVETVLAEESGQGSRK